MESSNITVITSITGGKDTLLEDKENRGKAKFIAFLDTPTLSPTWTVKPAHKRFTDPRRNSRIPKILSHLYVDTEYSIWIDGNIRLLKNPQELIDTYLKDCDIALFKHPTRDCIYDEAVKCASKGLDDVEVIIEQAMDYENSGYAKHKGLCECGIILRRHTDKVREFNEAWWAEFCRYSKRDQISFMYAADKVGIPLEVIDAPFILRPDGSAERRGGLAEVVLHNHFT